jgi:hypothetical protein
VILMAICLVVTALSRFTESEYNMDLCTLSSVYESDVVSLDW